MHDLRRNIGGHEYVVYGANVDLIEWASRSALAANALGPAGVSEDDLMRAFGGATDADRVAGAKSVIKKLWHNRPALGPYPFLETLSAFEFERFFYKDYRDHVCHQLKVYLLGLFAYDSCPLLRDALDESFAVPAAQPDDEFQVRWLVTAVYHDVGYVLETDQSSQHDGEGWKRTVKELNHVLASPLSMLPGFSKWLSRDIERKVIADQQIYTPRVEFPAQIERYNKIDLFGGLRPEAERAGLAPAGLEKSPVQIYYEYAQSQTTAHRKGFRDHGVASALLLQYTWRAFAEHVSRLTANAGGHYLLRENFAAIDELEQQVAKHTEIVRASAAAMALHNITAKMWNPGDALSRDLTFGRFCISLTTPGQQTPLAFLLGLVDSLQDWDRPRFRPNVDGERPPLDDQDLSITAAGGKLLLHLPADRRYADPAREPDSKYAKAVAAMKEYLEPEAVTQLVGWTDAPIRPKSGPHQSAESVNEAVPFAPAASQGSSTSAAIGDPLNLASQAYGKPNLFLVGTELIRCAKKRVALVAKTPIPIVGTRPYDGRTAPAYYEKEQYDEYLRIIRLASGRGGLRVVCVGSAVALARDLTSVGQPQFAALVAANLGDLLILANQQGSEFELRWNDHPSMTFLVADDRFVIWLKDDRGENVCVTASSELVSDALWNQACATSVIVDREELARKLGWGSLQEPLDASKARR